MLQNLLSQVPSKRLKSNGGHYDGFDVKLEKVLRARARRGVNCHGRYMPRMVVS